MYSVFIIPILFIFVFKPFVNSRTENYKYCKCSDYLMTITDKVSAKITDAESIYGELIEYVRLLISVILGKNLTENISEADKKDIFDILKVAKADLIALRRLKDDFKANAEVVRVKFTVLEKDLQGGIIRTYENLRTSIIDNLKEPIKELIVRRAPNAAANLETMRV